MADKLASLDRMVTETPQSRTHEAWRPSGSVKHSTAGHDLKVVTEEERELEELLEKLDNEVDKLEIQVRDYEQTTRNNMETIKKRQDIFKEIAHKIDKV